MIRKLDMFLIQQTTRAYLWLYDWTGVYVGTLMFAAISISWMLQFRSFWAAVIGVMIGVPACGLRYYVQATDEVTYNTMAEYATRDFMRGVMLMMVVAFCVRNIIFLSVVDAVGETMWLALCYLITVKIRKREPKNFFERKMVEARNER